MFPLIGVGEYSVLRWGLPMLQYERECVPHDSSAETLPAPPCHRVPRSRAVSGPAVGAAPGRSSPCGAPPESRPASDSTRVDTLRSVAWPGPVAPWVPLELAPSSLARRCAVP